MIERYLARRGIHATVPAECVRPFLGGVGDPNQSRLRAKGRGRDAQDRSTDGGSEVLDCGGAEADRTGEGQDGEDEDGIAGFQ